MTKVKTEDGDGPADYIDIDGASGAAGRSKDLVGGMLLVLAAAAALVWANVHHESYESLWETSAGLGRGSWRVDFSLHDWVNEGLMTIFFLLVGLEVKQAFTTGELRDRQHRVLPLAGALGGMIVPASLYWLLTQGTSAAPGWAIPMATDIAVAAAVIAVLGRRVPSVLRACLLSLAIVDDIGSVLVIALFYGTSPQAGWVLSGGALIAFGFAATRISRDASNPPKRLTALLVIVGMGIWWAFLRAGIHPTLAGVAVGLLAPPALAHRWEQRWAVPTRWIVALFALANAGIVLSGDSLSQVFSSAISRGVVIGLVLGKPLGISLFVWLAVRIGLTRLPDGVRWAQFIAMAALGGIGFTVSLFIAELSFGRSAETLEESARLAILLATLLAAIVGSVAIVVTSQTKHGNPRSSK